MAQKIMYCCTVCADSNSEGCGYFMRDMLREMPDGQWLYDSCFDDAYFEKRHDENDDKCWSNYPQPPEYGPVTSQTRPHQTNQGE